MVESALLFVILLFQLVALGLALYWFRGSTWRLLSLAMVIIIIVVGSLRRTTLLAIVLQDRVYPPPSTLQELIAFSILSAMLLLGVVIAHLMYRSLERTTAALRESEAHFRGMVEHLPGVVYRCQNDESRTLLYASGALEALTGYPAEDVIDNRRRTFASLICPEDLPNLEAVQDRVAAHEAYEVKYRMHHASGKHLWVLERGRGVFTESGKLLCLTGFISDITERVKAEQLLQVQRDLALALSRSAGLQQTLELCMHSAIEFSGMDAGGIYLVDPETHAMRLVCHTGLPEWFVKKAGFYPGDSINARLVRSGRSIYQRYGENLLKTDGLGMREGLKVIAIVPVRHDNVSIACIKVGSHTLEDIPEIARAGLETLAGQVGQAILRDQAQAIRREREENLTALFGSIRDMLFVLDEDGHILRANPAMTESLGYTEQELCGRFMHDILANEEGKTPEAINALLGAKRGTANLTMRARNGREIPVETSVVPGTWDGKPSYFAVSRDITERLQAQQTRQFLERQVQVAQKLESLGILAGGVAHDFNNLLSIILGNAELVREHLDTENPLRRRLEVIMQTSRHASELCRQMMMYSGRGPLVTEVFYPNLLLREMLPLLKTAIAKRIALKLQVPETLPPIKGDPSQMRQVIMNLSLNASEAIGDCNGTITIGMETVPRSPEVLVNAHLSPTSNAEEFILVTVADNGCGMDEETRKKLFDPFFSTKFTGRGLGMAAVLGIVSAHGGGIEVRSEVGKGTVFRLFFPVTGEMPAPEAPPKPRAVMAASEGGAILFVDDEDMLRDVGREAILAEGFDPLLAANGLEAVEQYQQAGETIRLVVLDMTMPVMNGVEAYGELLRIDPEVRIIIASGYSTTDFENQFAGKGLVGVLHKPYSVADLRETIRASFA